MCIILAFVINTYVDINNVMSTLFIYLFIDNKKKVKQYNKDRYISTYLSRLL